MDAHTLAADRITDAGHAAGNAIWSAVDAANIKREVLNFECMLDMLADEIQDEQERELFRAAALMCIPHVMLDSERRKRIAREHDAAYVNFVHAAQADAEAAAIDQAYDVARDERMMGDAA
ncbi:hypothetical protein UFOVP1333_33 [uncultured Caudovirales phage]|uniref:Uncharacterized protein n=1 Tax=uncultured Caudovirales phage TaxID=2100421 RepID=A0A6J5S2L1_9CAUD|nr:hypothetical protein UFOVP1333_33 [uncultured Caudovirales phage]